VIKLDGSGAALWADQVTDAGGAAGIGVALDRIDGTVYTIGGFQGRADFGGGVTLDTADPANAATYVSKIASDGGVIWARAMAETPITSGTNGTAIAVDSQGNAYTTGTFSGVNVDFAPGVAVANNADLLTSEAGSLDAFVAKHDAAGNFIWARRAGGAGADIGTSIAVDHAGVVYAGGWFSGQPGFFGQFFLPASSNGNSYVAELNSNGDVLTAVSSKNLSPDADRETGLAVDNQGFVDLTGLFGAHAQFDTMTKPGSLPLLTSAGDSDVFVVRLKPVLPPIAEKVIDGHILQLVGDARRIVITDDRHWGIMVAVDGGAPLMYGTGIDKVIVRTGDGNDAVKYMLGGPDTFGDAPIVPADLEVHFGNGQDALLVDASTGWSDPPSDQPWHIDVTGGAGVERSTFLFGGQLGKLDLEDQLGRKKNTVNVMIDPVGTVAHIDDYLKMHFFGTGGTDSVHALIGAQQAKAADRIMLNAAVDLAFMAGADVNPLLSVDYRNVTLAARQMLALTGIQSDAAFRMGFHNVLLNAPLAVAFSGGRVTDPGSTNGIIIINSKGNPLDGTLFMTDRSGPFADDIRVIYDFNPQPEPPGKPQDFRGSAELIVPHGDPFALLFEFMPQAHVAGQ
jgi:hypothetical protein